MNGVGKILVVLVIISSGIGAATFFRDAQQAEEVLPDARFSGLNFRGEGLGENGGASGTSVESPAPQQLETVSGSTRLVKDQTSADQPPPVLPGASGKRLPIPGKAQPSKNYLDGANWPSLEKQKLTIPQDDRTLRGHLHKIRDGDTLEELAERYLGNPRRADEIFEANLRVLSDPEVLPLGKSIRIPPSRVARPAARMESVLSAAPTPKKAETKTAEPQKSLLGKTSPKHRIENPIVKDLDYDDPNKPIPLFGPHTWAKSASVSKTTNEPDREPETKPLQTTPSNRPTAIPIGITPVEPLEGESDSDPSESTRLEHAKPISNQETTTKSNSGDTSDPTSEHLVPLPSGALRRAREESKKD